ncbi:hypothetical protein AAVH_36177 [Aphelenchoides avenae]|nr:hypothetical protein AAVH_36177 [Aphelenchus avenae]
MPGNPPNAASSSKPDEVHYRETAIRDALNLPNVGKDASRTMTAASQVFMEELMQRAAFEAERDGSKEVTPEHLKRVAAYVFLHF